MSKNKMGSHSDIPERKDIQERDDQLENEDGIRPGTNAQTAQFNNEDSTEQKELIKSQNRNAPQGKGADSVSDGVDPPAV